MYERKWNVIQDSREIIIHQISYHKTTTAQRGIQKTRKKYIFPCFYALKDIYSIMQRKSPTAKKDLKI